MTHHSCVERFSCNANWELLLWTTLIVCFVSDHPSALALAPPAVGMTVFRQQEYSVSSGPCRPFTRRTALFQQRHDGNVPFPPVWIERQIGGEENRTEEDASSRWIRFERNGVNDNSIVKAVADATFRWCTDFVLKLGLCPWTAGSLASKGAIQFYITSSLHEQDVRDAAVQLRHDVQHQSVSPSVAITFVIFVSNVDFEVFYQWFIDMEDKLLTDGEIGNFVTVAPFHNKWQFQDEDEALQYEKRSPFPTVSIVCTSEIDKAGVEATRQIGEHNEQVLMEMGASTLKQYYQEHVLRPSSKDSSSLS